jgi:hypothetical protein
MRTLPRHRFRHWLYACLLISLVSASALAAASNLYQWKDAKGVTHYSDKPPTDEQYKGRRINDQGAPVQTAVPAGESIVDPQCQTARRNLEILQGKSAVQQDLDGDGKPDKTLDDTERENQRALAQATANAYCKPPAAAGG